MPLGTPQCKSLEEEQTEEGDDEARARDQEIRRQLIWSSHFGNTMWITAHRLPVTSHCRLI
eukprot:3245808-Pyramimonas_sp.AAC.1